MAAVRDFPTIKTIRTYVIGGVGSGGDYHNVKGGHWLIDSDISTPCSRWEQYRASRTSWGINVLGSFFVEIEATDGTVGYATGFGGPPACWLVHQHFERFLVGADPRNTNLLFEQMYRASMFYGRKGLPVAVISVIDLALWDLLGKLRNEPVYRLIGGATKERLNFYCTGPDPVAAKAMGFWGAKVPLPFCPDEGHAGLRKNVEFLRKHREAVGPDFPIMVDCYMSLNVPYTIELARECLDININWWEECLSPDDTDGFEQIKRAHPSLKFTTGEHEYSRFGFRKLIEGRNLDIIQPDVMWLGGMTELLKVAAMAAAYDIPVVPHASGPYSYHFVMSQPNTPFQEYLANSPDGKSVLPVFGDLFLDEPIPVNGYLTTADLDKPGFGLTLNPAAKAKLIPSDYLLNPPPIRTLDPPTPVSSAPSENDEEAREIISETPLTPRTEPEKAPTTEAVAPTDKEDENVTEEIPIVEAPGEVPVAVDTAIDAPTEETPAPEAEVEAAPAPISDIPAAPTEIGDLVKQESSDQAAAAKEAAEAEAEAEAAPAPTSDIPAAPKEIGELVKQETSDQPVGAKAEAEAEAEAEAAPVPIADILAAPKEVGELVKKETSDQTAAAKEEAVAAEPAQTIPVATVVA